ncbi:MAG: NTP transferase domain-containing protein [Tannerellaceae bacterium]|jgi:NDP-sugar pyrophosphorylase family protein|nr:NTP transferase domain-containing protein [Tannerellaceae bacterium]
MDYAIIAAGAGSRLLNDGIALSKPLVHLGDEALIDRLLRIFLACNATSVNIIINEEMKDVQEHCRKLDCPVPLRLVIKSTPSSMHSFYELSHTITAERFVLTTVDTVFSETEFAQFIASFQSEAEADGIMAVTEHIDDESPLYVTVNDDGHIRSFDDTPGSRFISGGIYGLKQNALTVLSQAIEQKQFRMRNYQRSLINNGFRLKAFNFGTIIDVDHASDIEKAKLLLNV